MAADSMPASTAAALAALRERGAAQHDPVRYGFIEALARRTEAQQGAARQLLDRKLAQAISALAARCAEPSAAATGATKPSPPSSLLAGLLAELAQDVTHAPHAPPAAMAAPDASRGESPSPADSDELKALRYFRADWARLSVEQQLAEALANGPENAGPLNPHRLVLRALERMRALSPDYLHRFMTYVDALRWLEHADKAGASVDKPAPGDGERRRRGERAPKR